MTQANTPAHVPHASATSTGAGTFQSRLAIGGREGQEDILADEPVALGGLGTGPTPYDLLCAALATCTTMTLRFYAGRKGWDIGAVHTVVTHARVAGQTPPDQFSRAITLDPALEPAVRDELLGIANRCPVHKTLTQGATVATVLAA
ncbi:MULTISPECIES: OsmC family protein [unclassified Novosphingobium]|uniref:OsmC family protein n=1 Tax=unclassified Novosphingobium TaxID=2644732 RepID=UPI0003B4D937|nr:MULTISPECIES: OsmC family protein [unclassified Novosphingobium]MBB3357494.1 putative redox protein [Novosphingobium sp. BK256]MBB3373843.1 putative redox protein [Novosphingobium sp. BK280]MBB3378255.1 putative redox protein [Novosphingobium sp. BK258]MBB3419960.1 putative redox protein [Novosphingobium sp. BK267]MBB3447718.1 putative redox protein [Novosphingobium sp. BK352]